MELEANTNVSFSMILSSGEPLMLKSQESMHFSKQVWFSNLRGSSRESFEDSEVYLSVPPRGSQKRKFPRKPTGHQKESEFGDTPVSCVYLNSEYKLHQIDEDKERPDLIMKFQKMHQLNVQSEISGRVIQYILCCSLPFEGFEKHETYSKPSSHSHTSVLRINSRTGEWNCPLGIFLFHLERKIRLQAYAAGLGQGLQDTWESWQRRAVVWRQLKAGKEVGCQWCYYHQNPFLSCLVPPPSQHCITAPQRHYEAEAASQLHKMSCCLSQQL